MKFSDFKRLLGADPYSKDPEFLRARNAGGEYGEAAKESGEFEKKLQSTFAVNVPVDLNERILAHVNNVPAQRVPRWPMALAASIFMMLGATAVFIWQQGQVVDLEGYVLNHWQSEGVRVVQQARGPISLDDVQQIMASVNAHAGDKMAAQVAFIKNCPTPDGKGVHLVLATDYGPVTVFYMPKTEVQDARSFSMPGVQAFLVDLPHGSAAVIGPSSESVQSVAQVLDIGILPGQVST